MKKGYVTFLTVWSWHYSKWAISLRERWRLLQKYTMKNSQGDIFYETTKRDTLNENGQIKLLRARNAKQ